MTLFARLIPALLAIAPVFAWQNDFFAQRTLLTGESAFDRTAFGGTTREPGEPHLFTGSVWWEWTSPSEQGMAVEITGSPRSPIPLVFTGDWPNLSLVSAPENLLFFDKAFTSFHAGAGVTYYIAGAGPTNWTPGLISLSLRPGATNDAFAMAKAISGNNAVGIAAALGASIEPGESTFSPAAKGTLWWRWSPETAGVFTISAGIEGGEPALALYRADSAGNLTRLAAAAHAPFAGTRIVTGLQDEIYYVAIELTSHSDEAALLWIWKAAENDDFEDRILLPPALMLTNTVRARGATREPGEPGGLEESVWWQWTAPIGGSFLIDIENALPHFLEVFTGSGLGGLVSIGKSQAERNARVVFRAAAGTACQIRVGGDVLNAILTLRLQPGPINDDLANAVPLVGDTIQTNGTLLGATLEPGEPAEPDGSTRSIWWRWSPPRAGNYFFQANADGNLTLAAYQGDSLANLIPQAFSSGNLGKALFTLRTEPAETYWLRVSDHSSEASNVRLSIEPSPPNDDFSQARQWTGQKVTGTIRGATLEPGELALDETNSASVWYHWTPAGSVNHELILSEPLTLSLYEGASLGALDLIERNSASKPGIGIVMPVAIDPSKDYYVSISGDDQVASHFEFVVRHSGTIRNDDFADAELIVGSNVSISASTYGATREPEEPPHADSSPPRTIWYEWTAPATGGFYLLSAEPLAPRRPRFIIYEGGRLDTLRMVASTPHPPSMPDQLRPITALRASAGRTYSIAVITESPLVFTFEIRTAPENDEFENRRELPEFFEARGATWGATLQPREMTLSEGAATMWHQFTAPENGTYVLYSDPGAAVVYRGTALTNLVLANMNQRSPLPAIPFRAQAGETLSIAIESHLPFGYSLRASRGAANDDFAERAVLSKKASIDSGLATMEPGEPLYSTNITFATLWWRWSPPSNGVYRIQASHHLGFTFPGVLAVYTGAALPELSPIARIESFGTEPLWLDCSVEAGMEYSIALLHQNDGILQVHPPVANDEWVNASPLSTGEVATNTFVHATLEPGEDWSSGKGTLWYSWTAVSAGTFVFSVSADGETDLDLGLFPAAISMINQWLSSPIFTRQMAPLSSGRNREPATASASPFSQK